MNGDTMDERKVGVVGLGNMGSGIARNFQRAGVPLAVWDIAPAAREAFAALPGVEVATPGRMAATCSAIFFIVPATPEIAACFDGPDGVLASAAPGLVVYDFTTSDPVETRAIAERAARSGIAYLDAGMSGGAAGADAGTLTLMVGGDRDAFERTRDLLACISKRLYHLGGSGAGHTMKLIHNMVCHTIFLATCEGGRMAEAAGIDVADMIGVFNVSNARSYASEVRFPAHILSGKWDARSRVYNLRKDVSMAVSLAESIGAQVPLGTLTRDFLESAIAQGMTDTDFAHLYPRFDEIVKGVDR
ncbi:MAG: NAD(P)-dependent oxidoreductase [bacterium]|jgi:3-hydroxyisobutyrate dehydrogenase|nr:NAD(P)-dependent oxidoreductase [Betaproteobacteria bacterium]